MSKRSPQILTERTKQNGIVLFVSLVLLLVLTILAVSVVQTTSLEERMSRNASDAALAFQSAESALRDAEQFVETVVSLAPFDAAGTNGLWDTPVFGQAPRWETAAIWNDGRSVVAPTNINAPVKRQPRYIVEHVASVLLEENAYQVQDPYNSGASDRIEVFRITAQGWGGTDTARVLLQTTYGRKLN
jgi:type IV pilus assembly protein PilX